MLLRHHAWGWFQPEMRGIISKALGGAATISLVLLVLVLWAELRTQWLERLPLFAVALWYLSEEVQVLGGSVLYAIAPWPVAQGQPIVSALVGVQMEHVGLLVVAWLGAKLWEWRNKRG